MEFYRRVWCVSFVVLSLCFMAGAAEPGIARQSEAPMWHSTKPADAAVSRPAQVEPTASAAVEEVPVVAPTVVAKADTAAAALDADDLLLLEERGWAERAAQSPAIWVSVSRQRLYLIEGSRVLWSAPCGTATNGAGARVGSNQTPLGWHQVAEKFGDGAKWGQVFRSRKATREVWAPGMDTKEDLVLTRILWLEGLEPGINKGTDKKGILVDSKRRYIYIHGTNGEDKIGQPSSHGCIRLLNDDVITLYSKVPEGTPVLITE